MEWLSHSQKKYCELCKTSFRFTKLYAPDMPQTLPIHVFLQHMTRYIIRNVLNWARAILAISVWVCWLPFVMRAVWSFLFWVSDEGFGSGLILSRVNETAGATIELSSTILGMEICPASPLFMPTTTSSASAEALLSAMAGQSISEFLIRILLGPFKIERQGLDGQTGSLGTPSTLLGDVQFLRNLTPNHTVNRTITTILEGQIITILVIVCFILVILVRDYVVQQQPEINMRAAFAEPDNEDQPRELQPVAIIPAPAIERELHFEPVQTPSSTSGSDADTLEEDEEALDDADIAERSDDDAGHRESGDNEEEQSLAQTSLEVEVEPSTEETIGSHRESASVNDYMRIFRQAAGDKARILQIIEDEGLQEKLSYWVEITKRGSQTLEPMAGPSGRRPLSSASEEDSSPAALTPSSSEQSPSGSQHDAPASETSKGKQRWEPTSPPFPTDSAEFSLGPQAGPLRARAASDGPQLSSQSNPLGSNSWSFATLPASSNPTALSSSQDRIPEFGVPTSPADVPAQPGSPDSAWTSMNEGSLGHDHQGADGQSNHDSASNHSGAQDLHNVEYPELVDQPDTPAIELRQPLPLPGADNVLLHLTNTITDFMWGGLGEQQLLELAEEDIPLPVDEVAEEQWAEEPLEPVLAEEADANAADLEVLAPGGGMDPEAIEDLEDFEGVMELIGMRGPLAGLFQNAIFCAVLVTVTIFACIFFPYNIGRLSIWIIANPMKLARMLFEVSKLIQDATICCAGLGSWFIINIIDIFTSPMGGQIAKHVLAARKGSWALWTGAGSRVLECLFLDFPTSASEIKTFSAVSHAALLTLKGHIGITLSVLSDGIGSLLAGNVTAGMISGTAAHVAETAINFGENLLDPSSFVLDFSDNEKPVVVDPALAYWPGSDRFLAIAAGYATVFVVGALYLKRGAQFPRGSIMQAWEAGFIETLHQASGIVKVILIISIEMLVFPLYCGLLLDAALLPLFEGATFRSRTIFTYNYPLTSIFVHWFVGTGYMFHFALFVSMCRKIMRPGVLCKFSQARQIGIARTN
jgi:E3 ubiquitin-protein ligase MARCH6